MLFPSYGNQIPVKIISHVVPLRIPADQLWIPDIQVYNAIGSIILH